MERIILQKESGKNKKIKQGIVGIVLIIVMFLSIAGYSFERGNNEETSNRIIYNGLEFSASGGFWVVSIGNYQFTFLNNPLQVEKISFDLKPLEEYYGVPLYISSESDVSTSEIYRNLLYSNSIVLRMQSACLEGEKCSEKNLPSKNCSSNFIIIKQNETASITREENCFFINGPSIELGKITDEFLFHLLGIREE